MQEVAVITRALKSIARELEVPLVALSQLSRQIETRGTEPMLSDLRECVTGETRVIDATTGRWVEVRSLQPGSQIIAMTPDQKLGAHLLTDVWSTGVKPVYRLRTQSGREIRATGNHPFLTGGGWRSLESLKLGEVVATARRLPPHGVETPARAPRCRLLGYIAGDGTYQRHRAVGFISSDDDTFWDVLKIVQGEWPDVQPRFKKHEEHYREADFVRLYANGYGRPHGNPMREWLREIGVFAQEDSTKRVAEFVFEAGTVGAASFLAGYLATDGSVKRSKEGRWTVQFDSVSRSLLLDVKNLLLRLGLMSYIGNGVWNPKSTMPIYRLSLADAPSNRRRFAELVAVVGKKRQLLDTMVLALPANETNPGMLALPRELSAHLRSLEVGWKDQHKMMRRSTALQYADRTGDVRLREFADSDVIWERIVAIEPAGSEEVYDLRVPSAGSFVANGIVVHNSGAIEADADLVLFLWQKDRKDRDESVVRLKLAKHRNGPTGDFDLHFQSELTRFRDLGETRTDI